MNTFLLKCVDVWTGSVIVRWLDKHFSMNWKFEIAGCCVLLLCAVAAMLLVVALVGALVVL